jgi:multiple sugar transport system permease protein
MKYLMLLPAIAIILFVTFFPFILNVILSLYNLYGVYTVTPPPEKFCGVVNYLKVLTDSFFQESVLTTVTYLLGAASLELVLGFAFALLVHSLPRGRRIITTFLILPLGVSPVIYASALRLALNADYGVIPYYINLILGTQVQPLGLGNALFTLILVDALQWSPFIFLILYAGFQALPREPFEAALVDGASSFQKFRHITFPLLRPVIVVALVFRVIGAFKAFDIISILTGGGPVRSTTTLSYYIYQIFYHYHDVGKAAASSIIIATVLLLIFQGVARIAKIQRRA